MKRALKDKYYKTSQWRRIRSIQLRGSPFCQNCLEGFGPKPGKRLELANTVDHISPLWNTFSEFLAGPFQSLCKACHLEKTKTEDMIVKRRETMLKVESADV